MAFLVAYCVSKVRSTIYSEQGTGCCSHANCFPWYVKLGMLNPGTSTKLCGSSCQLFPLKNTSYWQPPSSTAWLVSPGLQGCYLCSEIRDWAAKCAGHTGVPFTQLCLLPDCNLALTSCLQCSNNPMKLWSYTNVFGSVLQKSTLSLSRLSRQKPPRCNCLRWHF